MSGARGVIGVRDATAGYRQIGEFSAHGLEPHDIALLADGRTMVIANGGIQTHPDSGDDELNIPDMQPSLVYVDVETGELLEEQRLAPATAPDLDPPPCHRGGAIHRLRLPISRPRGGRAARSSAFTAAASRSSSYRRLGRRSSA